MFVPLLSPHYIPTPFLRCLFFIPASGGVGLIVRLEPQKKGTCQNQREKSPKGRQVQFIAQEGFLAVNYRCVLFRILKTEKWPSCLQPAGINPGFFLDHVWMTRRKNYLVVFFLLLLFCFHGYQQVGSVVLFGEIHRLWLHQNSRFASHEVLCSITVTASSAAYIYHIWRWIIKLRKSVKNEGFWLYLMLFIWLIRYQ